MTHGWHLILYLHSWSQGLTRVEMTGQEESQWYLHQLRLDSAKSGSYQTSLNSHQTPVLHTSNCIKLHTNTVAVTINLAIMFQYLVTTITFNVTIFVIVESCSFCKLQVTIQHVSHHQNTTNLVLHCWRFGLYQRPSSEQEAGTSSFGSWHDKNLTCQESGQQCKNNWFCLDGFLIWNIHQPNETVY